MRGTPLLHTPLMDVKWRFLPPDAASADPYPFTPSTTTAAAALGSVSGANAAGSVPRSTHAATANIRRQTAKIDRVTAAAVSTSGRPYAPAPEIGRAHV